jgi:hypothetical protein
LSRYIFILVSSCFDLASPDKDNNNAAYNIQRPRTYTSDLRISTELKPLIISGEYNLFLIIAKGS